MYLSLFRFFPLSIYQLESDGSRILREGTPTCVCVFWGAVLVITSDL